MSKAFTRESDAAGDDDDEDGAGSAPPLPAGTKNYLTPAGYARLRAELLQLIDDERPKMVETVSWAAKNGDRSENGDYLYGKKRLREIDRRIRFLTKRLDIAEVADPSAHHGSDQVFFGATVTYANGKGLMVCAMRKASSATHFFSSLFATSYQVSRLTTVILSIDPNVTFVGGGSETPFPTKAGGWSFCDPTRPVPA